MISAYWNHVPLTNGKQVDGTYWMHYREDMYNIKGQFADLKRLRKNIGNSHFGSSLSLCWSLTFLYFPMLLLNLFAVSFFTVRILAFRFGWWRGSFKRKHQWHKRKKKNRKCSSSSQVFTTVLNIDDRDSKAGSGFTTFDLDSNTVICDNSANVHICNKKSMFIGEITPDTHSHVATIGGKQNKPRGVGTVRWTWKDDAGQRHSFDIDHVLYFPDSPVNILSVTKFAAQLKDDEGTGINTKRLHSEFYWQGSKFRRTIRHPPSNLPELPINEGWDCFTLFSKLFQTKVCTTKEHCHCHLSNLIPDDESAQPVLELSDDIFHVGETLLYSKEGHTVYVRIESVQLDEDSVLRFKVKPADGESFLTTREFLKDPGSPDIGWIPTSVPEKKHAAAKVPPEVLEQISQPVKLTPLQEEFLALHERLWHLPFSTMFRMVKLGLLPTKFRKLNNKAPPCVSCILGQAHKRPWRTKKTKNGSSSTLRKETMKSPGDVVGVDHLISAQPGLIPQWKGTLTRGRIWAASIFVDYVSGFCHVGLQTDQSAESTLQAKHEFEQAAASRGVSVKAYHADNGRFAEQSFVEDVKKSSQRITFCGVGAHHQNGISENAIKQLTLSSRTLLLHAQSHWPEYITTMLWPFALKAAADRRNQLHLDLDGNTPDMKFSDVAAKSLRLKDFHTFGCPCYVLDSRLQTSTKGVPKWEPRARLGIYLGCSPSHASNVALVLNPKTRLVSPQYHVVFDDEFTTVPHLRKGTVPANWADLVQNTRERTTEEFYDLSKTWLEPVLDPSDSAAEPIVSTGSSAGTEATRPSCPVTASGVGATHSPGVPTVTQDEADEDDSSTHTFGSEGAGSEGPNAASEGGFGVPAVPASEGEPPALFMPDMINLEESGLRRSARIASQDRPNYSFGTCLSRFCAFGALVAAAVSSPVAVFSHGQACVFGAIHQCSVINANFDQSCNQIHHMVLAAGHALNEVYTFRDMLKQEDKSDFMKAMSVEVREHEKRHHWEVVKRSTLPKGTKTIQSIWAFKRKRFPSGLLLKHKARLCAHGGMQQWGINYWETYAPVVNWISIRFLLVLSEIVGLESRAIDFVLAFPQADLDVPVYMEIPLGMEIPNATHEREYVLLLKKNLYGLKQASANWYDMLKKGLNLRGFKESVADPCVFVKGSGTSSHGTGDKNLPVSTSRVHQSVEDFKRECKDVIVLTYVDDCIILSRDKFALDKFVESLKLGPEKFDFTDEGTLSKYLGIEIERLPSRDGFTMTQPFLIERIVEAVNIDVRMTNSRPTPAAGPLLSRDEEGPVRKRSWNYRTLTGMLGYLQYTTRPDIAMATHQCARFNNNPKLSHERAILRICKYLLGTMDKGMIFKPDVSRGLECHVDADFAGGWVGGDHSHPEQVLSRAGFVISYAGCPIHWVSKMESEIALSTTEAEYIALSMAMRDVLPFLNLMTEIKEFLPVSEHQPKFFCKVWEDNRSCIRVAEAPKFTPRTKHIALKYHHFRQFVADGTVQILPISTLEQTADILTKPLPDLKFQYLRGKLCGW